MNVLLIGPSGAGKGTHAETLSARYRFRHLATGDLFRKNVQERTALGLLARKYMAQGELVPDEVVDAMIEEWADTLAPEQGMLFDGFPRTTDQVRFLEELTARLRRTIDAAIYLKVDDQDVIERLAGREICRSCQAPYHSRARPPRQAGRCDRCGGELYRRLDDTVALAAARLRVFHRSTEPVLVHYAKAGKLLVVSGAGSIADVEARLQETVEALANGAARFTRLEELARVLPETGAPALGLPAPEAVAGLDLVLLGGPGSGKGTQAAELSAQLRIPHIATGNLFRENLRQETELGRLARTYMDRGELVPDEVTDAMVERRLGLADAREGFILDGFPRSLAQAHALAEIMARLQRRLVAVLYIKVSDAAIVDRLSARLICRKCEASYHLRFKPPQQTGRCDVCGGELYQRSDDNPETVRARLLTFHRQTEPLIAYYEGAGLLREVDGEGKPRLITEQCLSLVRAAGKARAGRVL